MSVRIGIISDTHNMLRAQVKDILKTCDYILHAGDVTEESILDQIRFYGHLYVVRGNCDYSLVSMLKMKQIFQIEDLKFLMVHNKKDAGADVKDADVVVYGHSHKYSEEMKEGTLWLNPGSCGRSRFGGNVTMAVMTVDGKEYQIEKIVLNIKK